MASGRQGPYCYRCKRQRTDDQLSVLFNVRGNSQRYCTDEKDCEDFQFGEGKYAKDDGDTS